MSDNYWHSRRPTYTVEQTFQMGLQYLLAYARKDAMLLFKDAALHGHQHAKWLHDSILKYPLNHYGGMDISSWSRHLYNDGQEPRALRYVIWFSRNPIRALLQLNEQGIRLLKDDPLYHFMMGKHYEYDKRQPNEAIAWYRRAVDADFNEAFRPLVGLLSMSRGVMTEIKKDIETVCSRACEIGEHRCLEYLQNNSHRFQVEPLVMLKYEIRDFLWWRTTDASSVLIHTSRQLSMAFVAGREFADYDRYFTEVTGKEHMITQRVIAVYRQMTSDVRHASIQTILIMRKLGVCRDIAIVIAKSVYASRTESDWYSPGS